MAFGGSYGTGTVSTDADPKTILGDGTLWSAVAVPGDTFWAAGHIGKIASVEADGEIVLDLDWTGGALDEDEYRIYFDSPQRYDPAITQQQVRQLLALLGGGVVMYRVKLPSTAPDPGLGEDGDWALQTDNGAWKQWLKVAGVWELQSTPVGTNFIGPWDNVTEYVVNDQVTDDGSTYTCLINNTNKRPSLNPTEWELSASKGSAGNDGGVITIPLVFDGTSTADSDPGAGKIRVGPAASQRQATVWRVDLADTNAADWAGTFADLAAGTSTIKFKARLAKQSAQGTRLVANVTAVASPTGYRNLTVAVTDYSGDNPFTNGDALLLSLDPKGDKGDIGLTGATGPGFAATSTSSLTIQTGNASLTTQTGLAYAVGARVRIANTADTSKWMEGRVTAYTSGSGAMTVAVDKINNSGTLASWTINAAGEPGPSGVDGADGASALTRVRVIDVNEGDPDIAYEAGDAIDGVTLEENDLVLRATSGGDVDDGVYVVPASGAASRDSSFDAFTDFPAAEFNVMEGSAFAGTKWRCVSAQGGTLDSDPVELQQVLSMDGSNNLSELTDPSAARDNLELGELATLDTTDLPDPVGLILALGG